METLKHQIPVPTYYDHDCMKDLTLMKSIQKENGEGPAFFVPAEQEQPEGYVTLRWKFFQPKGGEKTFKVDYFIEKEVFELPYEALRHVVTGYTEEIHLLAHTYYCNSNSVYKIHR